MKVCELIEELQNMDPEAQVHFAYNYGDYWRTTVAPEINLVEEGRVARSEYHRMDKLLDEDSREFEKAKEVVVLHG